MYLTNLSLSDRKKNWQWEEVIVQEATFEPTANEWRQTIPTKSHSLEDKKKMQAIWLLQLFSLQWCRKVKKIGGVGAAVIGGDNLPSPGWNRVIWSDKYWGGQWLPWPPRFRHHCIDVRITYVFKFWTRKKSFDLLF